MLRRNRRKNQVIISSLPSFDRFMRRGRREALTETYFSHATWLTSLPAKGARSTLCFTEILSPFWIGYWPVANGWLKHSGTTSGLKLMKSWEIVIRSTQWLTH